MGKAAAGTARALTQITLSGALQTAVLTAIADKLAELHRLLTDPAADDRRVCNTLMELEAHLTACAPTPSSSTTACSGRCATTPTWPRP